jgi:nitroimidazol reductase NimA-like FMN-containing flavoprotein (pyridoxamine 5'-phosphate oxidase superfamily)
MSDGTAGSPGGGKAELEVLGDAECMRLISRGGIGRLAYTGRYGLMVIPVNYKIYEDSIVFRTAHDSTTDEDLRTGIVDAAYLVAFEVDEFDSALREGWSVLITGAAHHVDSEDERASVRQAGVEPWAPGERDLFMRIIPSRFTGRRIHHR